MLRLPLVDVDIDTACGLVQRPAREELGEDGGGHPGGRHGAHPRLAGNLRLLDGQGLHSGPATLLGQMVRAPEVLHRDPPVDGAETARELLGARRQ